VPEAFVFDNAALAVFFPWDLLSPIGPYSSPYRLGMWILGYLVRRLHRLITVIIISVMWIKEQIKSQEQCFRMPRKPKIEERDRDYRQQQCDSDRQPDPEIKNEINDHSEDGRNAVINCKNGE
jgi:hypothetical protein